MLLSEPDLQKPPCPSVLSIVWLHLAPGVVFSTCVLLVSGLFVRHGLTAYLAELVLVPTCLVPLLAGTILFWTRRAERGGSIGAAIWFRETGTLIDLVLWPVLLFLCWALCSLAILPLSELLEASCFGWFPPQLHTAALINGLAAVSPAQRHVTLALAVLLSGALAPFIEESYFRGFLLPRMSHLGRMAPVLNAFLFGLYHFFSPWAVPAVFVAFVPVALVVQAKRDVRIGMVVHAMFNLMGVLTMVLRTL